MVLLPVVWERWDHILWFLPFFGIEHMSCSDVCSQIQEWANKMISEFYRTFSLFPNVHREPRVNVRICDRLCVGAQSCSQN